MQTDNGAEFKGEFALFLAERGIRHRLNAPYCAWQNGYVERFHRTVAEECWLGIPGELARASTRLLARALQAWLWFYNHLRLHSGLQYRSPQAFSAALAGLALESAPQVST